MFKIKVKINIKKDAWNFWHACNKISHGVDWRTRIDESISKNIISKNKKDAYIFLVPYLNNYYKENNKILNSVLDKTQDIFDEKTKVIFYRMEELTKRKLYRKNFTCFLTTFPRCAYDYKSAYVWFYINLSAERCIDVFLHELLHFQFIRYFKDRVSLNDEQFEFLKEAMTIILNYEFRDLMYAEDKGYEIHRELRNELLSYWTKLRDFDKLVDYGIKILPSYYLESDLESIIK